MKKGLYGANNLNHFPVSSPPFYRGRGKGQTILDLLGDALLLEQKKDRPESTALLEVLMALTAHPAVT